ncbi:MAG: hypothetical protein HN624_03040 [Flavobacteriaceae bacterium]|nr:hypothetical protein [Flavobacteriaceae bacterium]
MIYKLNKSYYTDWTAQLEKAEKQQDKIWSNYLYKESNKIINTFMVGKRIPYLNEFYQLKDLQNLYIGLYKSIGLKMANWYYRHYEDYITKANPEGYQSIWEEKFAYIGKTIAGERIVSISDNRKKEFNKILKRYMQEESFMALNEVAAERVLRKKFKGMSISNGKRIVRTESVNAANYATNESATSLFGANNLQKEWMSGGDGRVRNAHITANGQRRGMNEKFTVMGEQLNHPGDSSGSAANVVNCRCASAPIPIV